MTVQKIQAQNIGKIFHEEGGDSRSFHAIQDVSLSIEAGRFVVIIGPSGCGKSTFLNIIGGFEKATSGQIFVDGRPVKGPGPDRGVVFQEFVLYPWRTVLGNVGLGLEVQKVPKAQRKKRAGELVKLVGLNGFEHRYPYTLSGGMKQRVAIARALAPDPETLLMDEPFGALDAQTRSALMLDLLGIWERMRKTIVFVTHSTQEAILLADKVVVFSCSPGTVCRTIDIKLPRPRNPTDPKFVEIDRELLDIISEQGRLGMRRNTRHREDGD